MTMMNTMRVSLLSGCFLLVARGAPAPATDQLTLVDNGKSVYQIVIREDASKLDAYSATELQSFIEQASGAKLPIVKDSGTPRDHEISLGATKRALPVIETGTTPELTGDGFRIVAKDKRILIYGAAERGTMYGVYDFLEEYLGCRWYSPTASLVPEAKTLTLPKMDRTEVPILDFREVYYAIAMDPTHAGRLKLNGNACTYEGTTQKYERHGGFGTWCHTSMTFLPPKEYFEEHPEYYSFRANKGERSHHQLCFSNPDIVPLVAAKMQEMIENPVIAIPFSSKTEPRPEGPIWLGEEDQYWDISQMDGGGSCECPNCMAIHEHEGSRVGSILTFINKIAALYPDKTISTLAYMYSQHPPKHIKPADNVAIMLCSYYTNREKPIAESDLRPDVTFRTDLEGWAKICKRVLIWDYVVNFSHLIAPHPNLYNQTKNIDLFVKNNTRGIFMQASREFGGEFEELRSYLLAKLLWDPEADDRLIIEDFLNGFYGPAGEHIGEYIDLMHSKVAELNARFYISDNPRKHMDDYLSPELVARYSELFDKAEAAVKGDPTYLHRVRKARMPLMYVKLMCEFGSPIERQQILDDFHELCLELKIVKLSERSMPPERFEREHREILDMQSSVWISPPGGCVPAGEEYSVALETHTEGARVYFTLDGSEPTETSTLYSKPLSLTGPKTIKARAFKDGKALYNLSSAEFTDAVLPYKSGVIRSKEPGKFLRIDVKGLKKLSLVANDAGDGTKDDFGNWADAKLISPDGAVTYLSDLTALSQKQGWGKLQADQTIRATPIRIFGKKYEKGLGVHPQSEVIYDLSSGDYAFFEARVGVDDNARRQGSVEFEVMAVE